MKSSFWSGLLWSEISYLPSHFPDFQCTEVYPDRRPAWIPSIWRKGEWKKSRTHHWSVDLLYFCRTGLAMFACSGQRANRLDPAFVLWDSVFTAALVIIMHSNITKEFVLCVVLTTVQLWKLTSCFGKLGDSKIVFYVSNSQRIFWSRLMVFLAAQSSQNCSDVWSICLQSIPGTNNHTPGCFLDIILESPVFPCPSLLWLFLNKTAASLRPLNLSGTSYMLTHTFTLSHLLRKFTRTLSAQITFYSHILLFGARSHYLLQPYKNLDFWTLYYLLFSA